MIKKHILLFLFIISTALITSCKKNEDDSKLLTSGKWYYDYVDNLHNVGTGNCFNETHYIEFRNDGTVSASLLGTGNYTLDDGGKTITIILNGNVKDSYSKWKGTIDILQKNNLKITLKAVREMNQDYGYEITLKQERNNQFCYKK